MSEEGARVSPLESRKRLLIAESELNRERMIQDAGALKSDVTALVNRVKSLDSIIASAAVLVSGLAAFRREEPANGRPRRGWLRPIIRGAGLVSTLWRAFRPKRQTKPEPEVEPEED
jgi:hypothetical protein